MATIGIAGTMDTKGDEHAFVAELVWQHGHQPLVIDVGILDEPKLTPDITRYDVAKAAQVDLNEIVDQRDRGQAVETMARGLPLILSDLVERGKIQGVISLGGGGGTAIATAGMRALPIGFPKVMVSTLASGNTAQYIGAKDIVMYPSIVDIAGLNRISRTILSQATGAICGMVSAPMPEPEAEEGERPLIAASMFGNTTDCVQHAKSLLERKGYEILVFHATGTGGRTMESLIESNLVTGVLDITTTEWADEVVGGVLSAGPHRLEAAAHAGIPAIVVPGCLDMVNFHTPESVPEKFRSRTFYQHNPQVTLMRTNREESAQLGRILAEKLNASVGPVTVLFPKGGLSAIGVAGQPFHDPDADQALLQALKEGLRSDIELRESDRAINDPAFAEACVETLLENIKTHDRQQHDEKQ